MCCLHECEYNKQWNHNLPTDSEMIDTTQYPFLLMCEMFISNTVSVKILPLTVCDKMYGLHEEYKSDVPGK